MFEVIVCIRMNDNLAALIIEFHLVLNDVHILTLTSEYLSALFIKINIIF